MAQELYFAVISERTAGMNHPCFTMPTKVGVLTVQHLGPETLSCIVFRRIGAGSAIWDECTNPERSVKSSVMIKLLSNVPDLDLVSPTL